MIAIVDLLIGLFLPAGLGLLHTPVAVNATNLNEPYAFHPAGANGVYADGHVAFSNASVNLLTYAALCTRAGGEAVGSGE